MNLRKLLIFNPIINLEEERVDSKRISIFGSICVAILFSLVIPLVIQTVLLISYVIIGFTSPSFLGHMSIVSVSKSEYFLMSSSIVTLIITILVIYKFFSIKTHSIFPEKKFKASDILAIAGVILGFRLLFAGSLNYIVNLLPVPPFIESAFNDLFFNPLIGLISAVVIAPIQEELVNRGIILNGLSKRYPEGTSLIISSLIFSIMHMNIPQGINAFLLGLILGYIYLKTKSILLSILCHCINNILAFIPDISTLSNVYLIIIISILAVSVGLILLLFSFKKLHLKERRIHFDYLRQSYENTNLL